MDADLARITLMAQHATIRTALETCTDLCERFRKKQPVAQELELALQELRRAITLHNDTENALIRALLVHTTRWGSQLIDRMVEEHRGEHDAMWAHLTGSIDDVVPRFSELVEQLDAHMAAEERTFLAPHVLRADVIDHHK